MERVHEVHPLGCRVSRRLGRILKGGVWYLYIYRRLKRRPGGSGDFAAVFLGRGGVSDGGLHPLFPWSRTRGLDQRWVPPGVGAAAPPPRSNSGTSSPILSANHSATMRRWHQLAGVNGGRS